MNGMKSSLRLLLASSSGSRGAPPAREAERAGHDVIRLARRQPEPTSEFQWDPYSREIDDQAVKGLGTVSLCREPG